MRIKIRRDTPRSRQLSIRLRYLHIWQVTGKRPFRKTDKHLESIVCSSCGTVVDTPYCPKCGLQYRAKRKGAFYRGAFDSVPFLNDEAKRTFLHLLTRPGYMMRDYINGHSNRYMAPLTSLIIFYAFFTLVFSIVAPAYKTEKVKARYEQLSQKWNFDFNVNVDSQQDDTSKVFKLQSTIYKVKDLYAMGYGLLHLDSLTDLVDSPVKASIASVETSLRSQGVPIFLGYLLVLMSTFHILLRRRYHVSFSACASIASYLLCQFCCIMLFLTLATWGKPVDHKFLLLGALMAWDFHQLFDIKWKKSIWLVLKTGMVSYLLLGALFLLAVILIAILVWQ